MKVLKLTAYNDYFNHIENNPLTKSQIKSVLTDEENTLIVAGAGSGKTRVLTTRLIHIINQKKAFPKSVGDLWAMFWHHPWCLRRGGQVWKVIFLVEKFEN